MIVRQSQDWVFDGNFDGFLKELRQSQEGVLGVDGGLATAGRWPLVRRRLRLRVFWVVVPLLGAWVRTAAACDVGPAPPVCRVGRWDECRALLLAV